MTEVYAHSKVMPTISKNLSLKCMFQLIFLENFDSIMKRTRNTAIVEGI